MQGGGGRGPPRPQPAGTRAARVASASAFTACLGVSRRHRRVRDRHPQLLHERDLL